MQSDAAKTTAYCCEKFAEDVADNQFEFIRDPDLGDGRHYAGVFWAINGCCGGGCYVVDHMRFCPYCGGALRDGR
jgi:hypothetical protein